MARKKSINKQLQESQAPEAVQEAVALSASEVQAAEEVKKLPLVPYKRQAHIATGRIIWIDCPLYEGLRVGFRVDNEWRVVNKQNDFDSLHGLRVLAAIAPLWEGWAFVHPITEEPIPAPDRRDLASYMWIYRNTPDLWRWLQEEGYKAALEAMLAEYTGKKTGATS